MLSWMIYSLLISGISADPVTSLNNPRPEVARQVPSVVTPAGHNAVSTGQRDRMLIPPAPLPKYTDEESPDLLFIYSGSESCRDSLTNPPAPPAEMDPSVATVPLKALFSLGKSSECSCESPAGPCAEQLLDVPATVKSVMEHPVTTTELHHLKTAIRHLEAAGMKQAARALRDQYRDSVAQLRQQIRQEILTKQHELQQITEELALLKSDLIGDASLVFQVEQCEFQLNELRRLTIHPLLEIRAAAQLVTNYVERGDLSTIQVQPQLNQALRTLIDQEVIRVTSAPQIRSRSGQAATVEQSHYVYHNSGERGESGTRLKLNAEIQEDNLIQCHLTYDYTLIDGVDHLSLVDTSVKLTNGETMCLCGVETITESIEQQAFTVLQRDQKVTLLLVTPRIVPREESMETGFEHSLRSSTSSRIRLAEGLETPRSDSSAISKPEQEATIHLTPTPFQLIPSPGLNKQQRMFFPLSPRRDANGNLLESAPVLPPAPVPADDIEESIDSDPADEKAGPVI